MTPQDFAKYGMEIVKVKTPAGKLQGPSGVVTETPESSVYKLYEKGGYGQSAGFRDIQGFDPSQYQGLNIKEFTTPTGRWEDRDMANQFEAGALAKMGYGGANTSKANIQASELGNIFSNYQARAQEEERAAAQSRQIEEQNRIAMQNYTPSDPTRAQQIQALNQQLSGMKNEDIYAMGASLYPDLAKQNPYNETTPTFQSYRAADNQPFVPPNQDAGMARNLKAEQDFVKNWQGKGGRLPTASEINQAVYGTANPQFNVPVRPVTTEQTASAGGGNTVVSAAGSGSQSGAAQTQTSQIPGSATTPTPTNVEPDSVAAIRKSLEDAGVATEAEKKAQADYDAAVKQMQDDLIKIRSQQIPMGFITGQSRIEQDIMGNKIATMEQKLAKLQKERAEKRQAALDVYKIESEASKTKSDQSFKERELAEKIAQNKREMEAKAASEKIELETKLATGGYDYVDTPKKRDELLKKGYDIITIGGRTYAKPPEAKKGSGTSSEDKEIKAFQNDAATYIEKLGSGEMEWGTAWNIMRAKYPQASNELIDQMLNKNTYYPR